MPDEAENEARVFNVFVERIRERLQTGGPQVDSVLIADYIDDVLPADQREKVEKLIHTWRSWWDEYWEMSAFSDYPPTEDWVVPAWEPSQNSVTRGPTPGEEEASAEGGPGADYKRTTAFSFLPKAVQSRRMIAALAAAACVVLVVGIYWINRGSTQRINDGLAMVTISSSGNLTGLDHLPPGSRSAVEDLLTNRHLARSPLLGGARGNGDQPSLKLRRPVETVVLSDRPTFEWQEFDGAERYQVVIYDDASQEVATGTTIDLTFTPESPLERGRRYTWELRIETRDGLLLYPPATVNPPRFAVLPDDQVAVVENVQTEAGQSHLALLAVYLQEGLLDAAEGELAALREANADSPIISQLEESVQQLRQRSR